MAVMYKKLFKQLIDLEVSKSDFAKQVGFSTATIHKMNNHDYISLEIVEKICAYLNCTPNDILEFRPDTAEEAEARKEKREKMSKYRESRRAEG